MTETDVLSGPPGRKRRVFPWVFLAIQAVFAAGLVAAARHAATAACPHDPIPGWQCGSAREAGAAVGAGVALLAWAAVDMILAAGYLVWRLARYRPS